MKRLGTDVLALACIAGGAGISVAATLALPDDPATARTATVECATDVDRGGSHVVVSLSSSGDGVVIAGDARAEAGPGCLQVAETHDGTVRVRRMRVDRVREAREGAREAQLRVREARRRALDGQERARAEMERARERLEEARVRIQGIERIDLEELGEFELELDLELEETLEIEVEQRLEDAMRQLEERLERLDDKVGN